MKDKIERLKSVLQLEKSLAKEKEHLNQEISAEIEKLVGSGRKVGFRFKDGTVYYGKIIDHNPFVKCVTVEADIFDDGFCWANYDELIF